MFEHFSQAKFSSATSEMHEWKSGFRVTLEIFIFAFSKVKRAYRAYKSLHNPVPLEGISNAHELSVFKLNHLLNCLF